MDKNVNFKSTVILGEMLAKVMLWWPLFDRITLCHNDDKRRKRKKSFICLVGHDIGDLFQWQFLKDFFNMWLNFDRLQIFGALSLSLSLQIMSLRKFRSGHRRTSFDAISTFSTVRLNVNEWKITTNGHFFIHCLTGYRKKECPAEFIHKNKYSNDLWTMFIIFSCQLHSTIHTIHFKKIFNSLYNK